MGAASDQGNYVYVSVGHQQMMTDPMKPLGLSVWRLTALRPMTVAGGRARVILDMAEADLEAGDILVTAYTDPAGRLRSSRSRAWSRRWGA